MWLERGVAVERSGSRERRRGESARRAGQPSEEPPRDWARLRRGPEIGARGRSTRYAQVHASDSWRRVVSQRRPGDDGVGPRTASHPSGGALQDGEELDEHWLQAVALQPHVAKVRGAGAARPRREGEHAEPRQRRRGSRGVMRQGRAPGERPVVVAVDVVQRGSAPPLARVQLVDLVVAAAWIRVRWRS